MHLFVFFRERLFLRRMTPSAHRSKALLNALFLSAFLLAAGCEREAPSSPPPPHVDFIRIAHVNLPLTKELSGRTSAYVVAQVRPQVGGIIQTRLFKEGDDVKAGDTLYQIDPALYRAARQRAEASVKVT